ncbi:hypothetical protein BDP27DRAFT_1441966 [Rhodocollybia butyracea]|uniref:Polyketide synthase n=1 Tax=Rhodocollybia butyracea TaxID=206335 RepID=A0A9P5Q359_9AGAR|nr:hypothetical protein BDP27DRAFT_1441966 [Rhodocollybia butyracea]
MDPSSDRLHVPIFAGQGSPTAVLASYAESAIRDSRQGPCSTLLTMCHEAFRDEISSLTALERYGVDLNDFNSPDALLAMWPSRFFNNPVLSSSTFVLIQLIRYLAFVTVEPSCTENGYRTPFTNVQSTSQVGVLGFSSGILAACVVAASRSTISYLSFAVEAYRLSIWIGIRCQLYRSETFNADMSLPWSVVFLGMSLEAAEEAISEFQNLAKSDSKVEDPSNLYITAVMDGPCVTISGSPVVLAKFSARITDLLGSSVTAHQTTVDTLYHSPALHETRDQILRDIVQRNIRFPELNHLRAPVCSTSTGMILDRFVVTGRSLVHLVIDMLLVEPVRWDFVASQVAKSLPEGTDVMLLNFGPATGLSRSIEKRCPIGRVSLRDLCLDVQSKQEPIAITGMAVNMPGAPNIHKLWEVLEQGLNTLTEIPQQRFNVQNYEGMKARTGNFIQAPDEFDSRFFKISPREAKSMDPQQRILLHAAYEALEDSGYVPGATPTSQPETFGCYIGAATHDYLQNLRDHVDVYYSTGTLKSFLSGRISYSMGFSGPSVVVDTACSSSLVAVHQAARALMTRDCNSALVGGVNVITSPDMFLGLDRGHFLSPTGSCKAFDASADGYSRGEGCGMFVLKRLSDAIAENDHIYGVIRSIEVNQSGLAQSITHPHGPTQSALFEQVLRNSAIAPSRVNVVEAHGTGTQAGDVNELASIRRVLTAGRSPSNPLHVTSVKGNIGHLEAASGVAGLAKLLLMLKHRRIPPQVSFSQLNPLIDPLESDAIVINRTSVQWEPSSKGHGRVALLNNFGAAGSNAALVLEDMPKDGPSLEKLRQKYIDWLRNPYGEAFSLVDIAYSMTARRQAYSYRLAVVASDREQLVERLGGAPYTGMGRILYDTSPFFKKHIDECHSILVSLGFPGVLSVVLGETDALTRLEEIEAYQAAIVSLEYALGKLWIFWGLSPKAVIGHSLGEYAALVFAGVLSLRGALTLVGHRVRLMSRMCKLEASGMLAINLASETVEDLLGTSNDFNALSISCINSPNDCVVSGSISALQKMKTFLDVSIECRSKMLAVPYGYHSDVMSPISKELTSIANKVMLQAPNIPIASNVYGTVVLPGDEGVFRPEYFGRHCSEPVQFDQGSRALCDQLRLSANDVWLEIGPHPTCLPMLKSNDSVPPGAVLLPTLKRNQGTWSSLGATLSVLFTHGLLLNWRNTFAHLSHVRCISLPSYPFSMSKYWVPYEERRLSVSTPPHAPLIPEYSLLHRWEQHPSLQNDWVSVFETPISQLSTLILGHVVGETPLCPASVLVEIALAGVELSIQRMDMSAHESLVKISALEFIKGLVYKDDVSRIVVTKIFLRDGYGTFSISSRVDPSTELVLHTQGKYSLRPIPPSSKFAQKLHQVSTLVFPRVVQYAKEYHAIQSLSVNPDELEGFASIQLPPDCHTGTFVAHPVFLDALLQVPGFIANMQGSIGDVFICSEIGSIKVLTTLLDDNATYLIHCRGLWSDDRTSLTFNVLVIKSDDLSEVVASVKGVKFCRMALETLRRGLSIAAISGSSCRRPPPTSIGVPLPSRARSHSSPPNFMNVGGELHARIIGVVAEICHVDQAVVTTSTELDALGIDSLMLIELSARLQFLFPKIDLQLRSLYSCKTVADIVRISSVILGIRNVPHLAHEAIRDDTELGLLGLDSMASIEVLHVLKTHLDAHLPDDFLSSHRSVAAIEAYLDEKPFNFYHRKPLKIDVMQSPPREATHARLIRTLRLVVSSTYYDRINSLGRTVFAIYNPNFAIARPWQSIRVMAIAYADHISSLTVGPVLLGGWSFGGVVAYEIALQLEKRGITTRGIVLIDSPSPIGHIPLPDTLIKTIARYNLTRRLRSLRHGRSLPPLVFLRSKTGYSVEGLANIPSWLSDRSDPNTTTAGWTELATSLKVWDIPGHHFQAFDNANIEFVSAKLLESCDYLDSL